MLFRRCPHLLGLAGAMVYASAASGTTYYVSPTGSDTNSGTSTAAPWQSLAKVDATTFAPGSQILFQAGGNWYGNQLAASSDGTASQPIVYGSYGSGANPTLWGSVPISWSSFQPWSQNVYYYNTTTPVNAFLVNHQFTNNAVTMTGSTVPATNITYVENNPNSSYFYSVPGFSGELVNLGNITGYGFELNYANYSAAVQADVISSNQHSNLVFQNFNVKESAQPYGGYGIRVENSANVQVLNSTVTAAGIHAVGVIDSTGFVGKNITASYLMPNQQYGGATAFVSYADGNVSNTTSQWINDTFTNPNGPYQAFLAHSNPFNGVTSPISNVLVQNINAQTQPAITIYTDGNEQVNIVGGQTTGDVQLEGNNTTVNGLLVNGAGTEIAIQGGSNNIIENSIINGSVPNWTAGRNGAIDDSGTNNTIRFNTISLGMGTGIFEAAIGLEGNQTHTQIYGNIINTPYAVFFQSASGYPQINAHDNLLTGATQPTVIFVNRTPMDYPVADMPANISNNEVYGNADFADAPDGDFTLQPGSAAAYVFNPASNEYVPYDYLGNPRPTVLASLGALQTQFSLNALGQSWNVDSNGNWSTPANWTANTVPSGTDVMATFGTIITAPRIVTVDTPQTVGTLYFSSPVSYTLAGPAAITISAYNTSAAIDIAAGSHTISAPLIIASPVSINSGASTTLTLAGTVNGFASITTAGAGTVVIATTAVISVPLIADSPVIFATNGNSGGILVRDLSSLTVAPRGIVTIADPGPAYHMNRSLLVTSSLTFSSALSGVLDLTSNDVDVQNGSLPVITSALATGYNSGAWNGASGILSSTAAADSTHLTTLGVILNTTNGTQPLYGATPLGLFDGTTPGVNDVLVKYTYYGDANLNGRVDGSDYSRIDSGYLAKATGWYNGDFNYDGTINGSDYTLIDNVFNTQGPKLADEISPTVQITSQIAPANNTVVPEPAGLILMSASYLGLLGRKRRKQQPMS